MSVVKHQDIEVRQLPDIGVPAYRHIKAIAILIAFLAEPPRGVLSCLVGPVFARQRHRTPAASKR